MLILGGITAGLWLALLFLRVPSSIAFLSLLIGQLLSTEVDDDIYSLISSMMNVPDTRYVQIGLLVAPLVLTVLILHGRVAKSKVFIEAIPLLLLSALTLVLLGPLLDPLNNLLQTATNGQLTAYKSIIVVAASASGLVSAWLSYPKAVHLGKSKKHAKH